jgi:hypothetical protein
MPELNMGKVMLKNNSQELQPTNEPTVPEFLPGEERPVDGVIAERLVALQPSVWAITGRYTEQPPE